jgi:hypothetical protein
MEVPLSPHKCYKEWEPRAVFSYVQLGLPTALHCELLRHRYLTGQAPRCIKT